MISIDSYIIGITSWKRKEGKMNLRKISFGFIILTGISFCLVGCGEWKPLEHSITKHSKHHHGSGAKAHKEEHPSD